jgi:hypothetical protein
MKLIMQLTLGVSAILCSQLSIAAVYKSVDANGNVVYSDSPTKNAKEISLPPISIVPSLSPVDVARASSIPDPNPKPTVTQYQLSFVSPLPDQVIRKPEPVSVNVNSVPALANGDVMTILLNGVVVANGNSATVSTEGLDRGSHSLSARVVNSAGQVVSQASSSLNIQQVNVNSPANNKKKGK